MFRSAHLLERPPFSRKEPAELLKLGFLVASAVRHSHVTFSRRQRRADHADGATAIPLAGGFHPDFDGGKETYPALYDGAGTVVGPDRYALARTAKFSGKTLYAGAGWISLGRHAILSNCCNPARDVEGS